MLIQYYEYIQTDNAELYFLHYSLSEAADI